ncbi:hypothetical protein DXD59_06220 [Olsenella sp. TM06-36]|uniref:alpha/beta hydrolase-fold protein n=1 Tax=Olsenella sp. TM06-36 TaxID=2292361 RepID=UPI000E451C08|nr:alpha/beta hydrolase-fold protein [Olsenella sp. TM06-36]RGJ46103.1 hypothetical protein DXD59_06220 [Olsenella sp. TM06-36]
METKDFTLHREGVDGDFDVTQYGTAGRLVIAFPEGDSSCASWGEGGMVDALAGLIDAGRVRLFCVDSADDASWYAGYAPADYRLTSLGGYFDLVENELAQLVRNKAPDAGAPIVVGAGLGALNATIAMLRKPSLYGGLLALSGTYDAAWVVGDAMSDAWRAFSPVDLVRGLGDNPLLVKALSGLQLAFVCGTGAGEEGGQTQRTLQGELEAAGVGATFEYWGADVDHSWNWWQEEARQLLPCLLEEGGLQRRHAASVVGDARAAAQSASADVAGTGERLEQAKERLAQIHDALAAAEERTKAEQQSVAEHAKEAERLAAAARDAWAEKDRIAALLEDAIRKGNEAQVEADKAAAELSSAQWIAGEAEAAVSSARSEQAAAEDEVARAEEAVEVARAREAEAKARLQAVLDEASEKEPATAAPAKKPAAPAKKTTAPAKKPATRKKPATAKKASAGAKKPSTGTKRSSRARKSSGNQGAAR